MIRRQFGEHTVVTNIDGSEAYVCVRRYHCPGKPCDGKEMLSIMQSNSMITLDIDTLKRIIKWAEE